MPKKNKLQPGGDEQARSLNAAKPGGEVDGAAIDERPTMPEEAVNAAKPGGEVDGATIDERPTMPEEAVTPEAEARKEKAAKKEPVAATKKEKAAKKGSAAEVQEDVHEATTRPQVAVSTFERQERVQKKPVPVIAIRNLRKTYIIGRGTRVDALRGVSLEVYPGEFVAIMGPSGSGKSTFMNLLGCLDHPSGGEYWLAGNLVSRLSSDQLAAIRNRLLGFVFQGFNLLGRATAMSNVELPMVYAGISKGEREVRARKVLTLVGLGARLHHRPTELSGGQQQRVAIARALVNGPSLLLADEPTGNLDSRTSVEIMGVMQALNDQGLTIVLVTHDPNVAQYARRQVAFLDGRIVRDEIVKERRNAVAEWEEMVRVKTAEGTTQIKEEKP